MALTTRGRTESREAYCVWFATAALLSFALWWIRFEYTWASGDQDDFIPYLLHLIDGDVLAADWFVQTQSEKIGVRTPFVLLLRGICFVLSPRTATDLLFVVSWIGITWSIFSLSRLLGGTHVGAILSAVAILSLTPKWTLGSNDVVYTMLVPEMTAWAIGLPALVTSLRGRHRMSGLLVGLSGWLQILVGIHLALLLAFTIVLRGRGQWAAGIGHAMKVGGVAFLVMSPMLIIIGWQQLSGSASSEADLLWVLAHFRAPYHYLPQEFSPQSYLKFALVASAGAAAILWFKRSGSWTDLHTDVGRMLAVIAVCCTLATIFIEVVPLAVVVKLQLFKLTVVAKVLLITLACSVLGVGIAGGLELSASSRARYIWIAAALALTGIALTAKSAGIGTVRTPISPVERWAASSAALDDIFQVPPSVNSFRSRAQRPLVVNYAGVPFAPSDLREWYSRITDIAPVSNPVAGIRLKSQLDSSFHARGISEWQRLARKYGIDYLVHERSSAPAFPFPVAFRDSTWIVYRLTDNSSVD